MITLDIPLHKDSFLEGSLMHTGLCDMCIPGRGEERRRRRGWYWCWAGAKLRGTLLISPHWFMFRQCKTQ